MTPPSNTLLDAIALATQCAACNSRPPLRTPLSAVIRAVNYMEVCTLKDLLDIMPLSKDSILQNISRLRRADIIRKERTNRAYYWLTPEGKRLVNIWDKDISRFVEKIHNKIPNRNV